jgi:hypothetical protein
MEGEEREEYWSTGAWGQTAEVMGRRRKTVEQTGAWGPMEAPIAEGEEMPVLRRYRAPGN